MKKFILFLLIICSLGLISACDDKKSSSSTSAMNTIPPLAVVID